MTCCAVFLRCFPNGSGSLHCGQVAALGEISAPHRLQGTRLCISAPILELLLHMKVNIAQRICASDRMNSLPARPDHLVIETSPGNGT